MKTELFFKEKTKDITKEIIDLENLSDKGSIRLAKRLRNKLPGIKTFLLYAETHPKEEYCYKEIERISNRILELNKLFILPKNSENLRSTELTRIKKDFENEFGITKLKSQLKALRYILSDD